jgi:Zn-dependent M28 family amino/carboxypeptidase
MGGASSLADSKSPAIHHGADDNASGTSALIEIASILASPANRPKRTVVFIAFSGEELGLLGSVHYVKSPVFPIKDTVAMVNLDMVGRMKDKSRL